MGILTSQTAGDNAQQLQVGGNATFINVGVSEERVRQIVDEKISYAIEQVSLEAKEIAIDRISRFNEKFIERMVKLEDKFDSLKEPAVQRDLLEAQKSAACCDNDRDLDILSDLLLKRIKNKDNKSGVSIATNAIKVIGELSSEALGALVAKAIVFSGVKNPCTIEEHIRSINLSLLAHVPTLPSGDEWLEQLEILKLVRLLPNGIVHMKKTHELFKSLHPGYFCNGFKENSDQYNEAIEDLKKSNLPMSIIVPHELHQGYFRLCIFSDNIIDFLTINKEGFSRELTLEEKTTIRKLYNMQTMDAQNSEEIDKNFVSLFKTFPKLKQFLEWWDNIPIPFTLTATANLILNTYLEVADKSS